MSNNLYQGIRGVHVCTVCVNGRELPWRTDLWNHSPTGFEWGYGGSGPAQLALAMLAFEIGDEVAKECHQAFKREVVSHFERSLVVQADTVEWECTGEIIREWYRSFVAAKGGAA